MAPIKERILLFIEHQQIKKQTFFQKIGCNSSTFRAKSLQSELSGDKIAIILAEFPEISPDWLLLGKGEMLRQDAPVAAAPVAYVEKLLALTEENSRLKSDIIRLMADNQRLRLGERSSPAEP